MGEASRVSDLDLLKRSEILLHESGQTRVRTNFEDQINGRFRPTRSNAGFGLTLTRARIMA